MKYLFTTLLLLTATATFGQLFSLNYDQMKLAAVSTDRKYGYEPTYEASIKVGAPDSIPAYLNALKGPNGEKVTFFRTGSCCGYKSPIKPDTYEGLLARWQVTYEGLAEPRILYLNKNVYEKPLCPVGFTFKTTRDEASAVRFPAEKVVRVKPCGSTSYAVNSPLLTEALGRKLTLPATSPAFVGGPDALKQALSTLPLTDATVQRMVFKVLIAFLVTCDGKAGNFQIITKGKGDMETYANQVLSRVNGLKQQWQPATFNNRPVDSYQVLDILVVRGQLQGSY